jgi:putative hemolysin
MVRLVGRVRRRAKWQAFNLMGAAAADGRLGSLEIRLAQSVAEVKAAQHLRYRVFYKELDAVPGLRTRLRRRDHDAFDPVCDHLVVIDHAMAGPKPAIVATCRLLRQTVAEAHGGFYSSREFDLGRLVARHTNVPFLEIGRSCVLPSHRTQRTIELLWHGIWSYVLHHEIGAMVGCGSLIGTDLGRLAMPLSFLYHNALAPTEWQTTPVDGRRVEMNLMPAAELNTRGALAALPPLIKGYLRLGGRVADGAVVDSQFGTTDVLIILPVDSISARYVQFYGPEARRHAA